jgi:hypothetical protein
LRRGATCSFASGYSEGVVGDPPPGSFLHQCKLQVPRLRSLGFPVEICGVDALHALLLRKGAHAALSSATWQEIRVGMTKKVSRVLSNPTQAKIRLKWGTQRLLTMKQSKKVTNSQDDDSVGELTERRPLCGSRGAVQVPRLRSGMTKWRAVAHLGICEGGWTGATKRPKPFLLLITYVRPEARTLQKYTTPRW